MEADEFDPITERHAQNVPQRKNKDSEERKKKSRKNDYQ